MLWRWEFDFGMERLRSNLLIRIPWIVKKVVFRSPIYYSFLIAFGPNFINLCS